MGRTSVYFVIFTLAVFALLLLEAPILPGTEANTALESLNRTSTDAISGDYAPVPLVMQQVSRMLTQSDMPFALRLPSVIVYLGVLGIWYFAAQRILGREYVRLTMLVAVSIPGLMVFAKLATADIWLAVAMLLLYLSTVWYLKAPHPRWLVSWAAAFLLGAAAHFGYTVLFSGVLIGLISWRHAQGRQLLQPLFGGVAVVAGLLLYIGEWSLWPTDGFYTGWSGSLGPIGQVGIGLLGMGSWLFFLPAALVFVYRRWRAGEELSMLLAAGFIAALITGTIGWWVFGVLLVAKQAQLYFSAAYPLTDWVKATSALVVIATAMLSMLALLSGFTMLGAEPFRAIAGTLGLYFALQFVAVLGVYSANRRMLLGGAIFSGIGLVFMLSARLLPVLPSDALVYDRLAKAVTEVEPSSLTLQLPDAQEAVPLYYESVITLATPVAHDRAATALPRPLTAPVVVRDTAGLDLPGFVQVRSFSDGSRSDSLYFFLLLP